MTIIKCSSSECKRTNEGGHIFYQCNHCGRWWCNYHGSKGQLCKGCQKGYLKH